MYKCNKNKAILQTTYLQVVVRKQYWYIVNRCNHFFVKSLFYIHSSLRCFTDNSSFTPKKLQVVMVAVQQLPFEISIISFFCLVEFELCPCCWLLLFFQFPFLLLLLCFEYEIKPVNYS